MKAMLLAAGLGTRLKPFTDHHPKALVPIQGMPVLQRNILYLYHYGMRDIIINVHHFAQQIEDFTQQTSFPDDLHISFSDEREEVLETGGGLKKASWFFRDTKFLVLMNADILTDVPLNKIIDQHTQNNALATLAVSMRDSTRSFLFDKDLNLCGWRNTQKNEERISRPNETTTPFSFSGIHVISAEIFNLITHEGKFSMVDVYLELAKTHNIQGFDHTGALLLDVGKPEALQIAEGLTLNSYNS